jgi:hypothetical protein
MRRLGLQSLCVGGCHGVQCTLRQLNSDQERSVKCAQLIGCELARARLARGDVGALGWLLRKSLIFVCRLRT